MKVLDKKVRIHDAETLEFLGEYAEDRVGIINEDELVLDFHRYRPIWVIIVLVVFGTLAIGLHSSKTCEKLEAENKILKETLYVAEYDLNVELLAGRYATSRTHVPKDMDEVYKMCIQSGAWYPEVIMAQFIIESGSGTSNIAKKARNFYGMRYIGTKGRPNLQIPNANVSGYGMYLNWQHSILDRVLWDDWMFSKAKPESREKYLTKINGVYAEDPNYITKVTRIANEWAAKTDSLRMVMEQDSVTIIR